jgi:hypothetical protein
MSLILNWCSHEAAIYAVHHWHYSRSLPPPPHNRIGVWEDGQFIGCVLFARGATPELLKPYGLAITDGCELVRIALTRHQAPVSRIVAIALRLLVKRSPGMQLVISFADPAEGHYGGIYQALGWVYLGTTEPSIEFVGPNGKRWHGRMVSPTGFKKVYGRYRRVLRPTECTRVRRPGKHRYALALNATVRAILRKRAQPYPKRGRSADSGTAVPTAGDGAHPIRPLSDS